MPLVKECAVNLKKLVCQESKSHRTIKKFLFQSIYTLDLDLFGSYKLNKVSRSNVTVIAELCNKILVKGIYSLLFARSSLYYTHMVPVFQEDATTLYNVCRSGVKVILDHTNFLKDINSPLSPFCWFFT